MCGIVGKLHFDPGRPISADLIQQMNSCMVHRGPDSEGVWRSKTGRVALAQRRLAIVDLSPTGYQPMLSQDGNVCVSYNGEIYNHPELKKQFEQEGVRYRGTSDTETLLNLYQKYGADCVSHMRGMFAIGLWDEAQQRLFLARDRFGQKPLYYAITADGLTFASEIQALIQDPFIPLEVDLKMIDTFLSVGFIPAPHTIFKGIKCLPPASRLIWQDGNCQIEQYWSLDYLQKSDISESDAIEQTRERLKEAVRLRLMADVPLGAFLSGGVDSSAVVALMAELSDRPVKTFSIGFEDQSFNETEYARQIANLFSTEHQEFTVTSNMFSDLPALVHAYGQPFADSSALPTWHVARLTRQHVTVALNGDGGDEMFGGYTRYLADSLSGRYAHLPRPIKSGIHAVAGLLPEPAGAKNPIRRFKNFVRAQDGTAAERYARWLTLTQHEQKQKLYSADMRNLSAQLHPLNLVTQPYDTAGLRGVDRPLAADVAHYLPDNLLVKADIATMAHSLEGRSPFLDHELAQFAASLPPELKLKGRETKYILKKSMEGVLPDNILYRPKQGFSVPIGRWFREELRQPVRDLLLNRQTLERGWFDASGIETLLDEHISGRRNHRYAIWSLLVLELWAQTVLDRPRTEHRSALSGIL
ncbi:MAG: asparagine synthase (glutamine-hydrolyzing) [Anaerolineae bacterium]